MDVARLLQWEISLADRSEPRGAEALLLLERRRREQVEHVVVDLVVQSGIDAVAGQDGEADLVERLAERLGETGLVLSVATQERREVEDRDLIFVVERVAFVLGQPIGVRLSHLIVLFEVAVEGVEIGHDTATAEAATPSFSSRRPIEAARNMIAEV